MANPTSTGLGQGLAQVFTGTRAADVFAYQQQLEDQRRIKQAAEAAKAQQELSGKYDDLYKAELFETRDTDWYYDQVQAIKDKYTGSMEDIAKNRNPALTRQFQDDILQLRLKAKQSKAVKDGLKDIRKDMFIDHPDLYSEDDKQRFEAFVAKDNAGSMEIPRFNRKSGIDIDKYFTEKIYTPTAKMAADIFTRDGYYEQTLPSGKKIFVDTKNTTIPKEIAEEQWSLALTDPQFILAINERFGDEAEQTGADPMQLAHDYYVPRLMINKRDMSSRNVGDDGSGDSKAFDSSLLTNFSRKESHIYPTDKQTEEQGKVFPELSATAVDNVVFYPMNFPVTIQTGEGGIDWTTGAPMADNWVLSGSVAGIVNIPVKNNRINKKGTTAPYAIVRDAQGSAVAVPVSQIINQGKQKGYDMDNIINGVMQSNTQGFKGVPEGGF